MPASAVIPAPRAYLKIVAVKKPVVEARFMGPLTQGSNLCGYVVSSAKDFGVCTSAVGEVVKGFARQGFTTPFFLQHDCQRKC